MPETPDASNASCPCGSGEDLAQCCLPYISGRKQPATAEQLLRSRYTAFARGEVDYILSSHHSKTRKDVKRDEIEQWSRQSEWLGLNIVQSEAGKEGDRQGTIVFCAKFRETGDGEGKEQEHWEQALFEKENEDWKFLDARGVSIGTYRRTEPKVGRNDVCPCGSGKKFKKCCGK